MTKFFTKRNIYIIIGIILLVLLFYFILPVSVPLIVALITAMILDPLVRLIQRRAKLKRKMAVIITFIVFVILIGLFGYVTTTKLVTEAINIVENTPKYINDITNVWFDLQERLVKAAEDLPTEFVHEISDHGEKFLINARDDLLAVININNLKALLTYIPNFLVSFLVYLIALFLFLLDIPRLRQGLYSFLSEETQNKVSFMTSRISYVIIGFFKAQFLVSLLIFAVSLIGLFLIVPDVALFMSIVIWLIDFIPIIGSIVILGPWALFQLLAGDPVIGVKLAILAAILLIIRRTVEPKVMGTHIGLSPLATLIAMFLGLKLLGIAGFIVGPLLVIAFNTAREAGIIKLNFKI